MTPSTPPPMPCKGSSCRYAAPELVERLHAMVTFRTDEALNARFGISYNSWRKLVSGQPVRESLLCRLEMRISQLEAMEK